MIHLPEKDQKLIEDIKLFIAITPNRDDEGYQQLLSIISRQQKVIEKAVQQRDEEMQYNPMSKSTKEAWKDRKNNQLQKILEGEE